MAKPTPARQRTRPAPRSRPERRQLDPSGHLGPTGYIRSSPRAHLIAQLVGVVGATRELRAECATDLGDGLHDSVPQTALGQALHHEVPQAVPVTIADARMDALVADNGEAP